MAILTDEERALIAEACKAVVKAEALLHVVLVAPVVASGKRGHSGREAAEKVANEVANEVECYAAQQLASDVEMYGATNTTGLNLIAQAYRKEVLADFDRTEFGEDESEAKLPEAV